MRDLEKRAAASKIPAVRRQKCPHSYETAPVFTRVVALQRTIGNAAVTHLLRRTTPCEINLPRQGYGGVDTQCDSVAAGGTQEHPVIQRLPAATSDRTLANEYMAMVKKSATFRELDKVVARHQPINLVDSGPSGPTNYDPEVHEINMPSQQPTANLRASLLWEMHNARSKGPHRRARSLMYLAGSADDSPEQQLLARYYNAAFALAGEWVEWTQLAAFSHRADRVNSDLGGGEQVTNYFAAGFDRPGEGWFEFVNYLEEMLEARHTAVYDPAAGSEDWVGEEILQLAYEKAPASMVVTEKEFGDFRSGRRRQIKDEAHNPFKSRQLVWRAANDAWLSGSEDSSGSE